jgi:hypothetical protein
MPRRTRTPERTGPKYPGTCDFTGQADPLGARRWERQAAEPDPGDDPAYEEDCDDC